MIHIYGRIRMYHAFTLYQPEGIKIPSEWTVCRVMEVIGLNHCFRRKINGITQADLEAQKSDNVLKRDLKADEPLKKWATDTTEAKAIAGKLHISVILDCCDAVVLRLTMETNMKATLCTHTIDNVLMAYSSLKGAITHFGGKSLY